MLRFIVLRAWVYRALLGAVLLTVLLTTAVLAALTAYSGAIGDAALRRSLAEQRTAAEAALVVKANVPGDERQEADDAVHSGARTVFAGLPVRVRTLLRSGPYALPLALRPASERDGNPNLTYFAALDRTQVRTVAGRLPRETVTDGSIEAALPQSAAQQLKLAPGARLTVTDQLDGPAVRVLITGVYRPVDVRAPYWQLDDLGGRGAKASSFTTYGPLLTAAGVPTSGRVSVGASGWLVSADYSSLTTQRIGALREAARSGSTELRERPALSSATAADTALPEVLDRIERSLLVTRSSMLIVAAQLGLLAACALLLVARLLDSARTAETGLLRARGATRARLAGLAASEALLISVPAVVVAPLLSGPLTRLLVGQGALGRTGVRVDLPVGGRPEVWAVAAGVAALCALAVAVPALRASFVGTVAVRAGALPAPLRAGADVGLLAVAGVAFWLLRSQRSGAVTADREGVLGVDPLLVAAPALLLLAGTVLALRLLPSLARVGERLLTRGHGLTAAMVGWQFSRRPMRGAGPVLLLVISVALGVVAIGQGASWHRSQADQADFRAGAEVRVLTSGGGGVGRTDVYADLPHVDAVAPAVRGTVSLSGSRTATVVALNTAEAAGAVLARRDLTDGPLLAGLAPRGAPAGTEIPKGTARLTLTAALHSTTPGPGADVTLTVRDRHGTTYDIPSGHLASDGRSHRLTPDLNGARGPLTLTGLELSTPQPISRPHRHRLILGALTATAGDGDVRQLTLPTRWATAVEADPAAVPDDNARPTRPRITSTTPVTMTYGTGYQPPDISPPASPLEVRLKVAQPAAPEIVAVATDRYLTASGAREGQRVEVAFDGRSVPVRIVRTASALPTTEATAQDGGALLVDLRAVNRVLQARYGTSLEPTEWWLRTAAPGATAAAVRALPDVDPEQVMVRDEIAAQLRDDPFGAAPEAALVGAAVVTVLFASLGFAVSAAGAMRSRDGEFAVLRALGTPRRRLARLVAVEHGVLVALALLVGTALGTVLTHALVPLVVLTGQATRPLPPVLVELPLPRLAALLAALAAGPALVTVALALRRAKPVMALRDEVTQ
ncbi:ABC transporter permease [Streptomyces europaeiscabiei]|uniref:ABC transporter permease n=1 Tax=Streptomyces europaeiscabiei TaxID=146819 RepID=A0ABU4NR91_9ACTN|nr:ABC transporter permease [Streptomyces europaeiscabiei]MDX2760557.1 ABC transporter permease [Streptomyces europaeiscabiei]MDX3546800.1 ABC transporter permease [Streptomyces europaeiscabiei]MDX3556494.1 ABC transporter permease [Streptomyces europaeiscabiei]MDX3704015.1 ABC transporter permease [Streptomyces europaeiscabiei]